MSDLHTIRITVPDGRGILSRIEVDGEELRGVTAVSFGLDMDHNAVVTVQLYADLVIEGEAQIVKAWRQGLPWWRRLPYWMHRAAFRVWLGGQVVARFVRLGWLATL